MASSYNGWPASKDPHAIGINPDWAPIPGHKMPGGVKSGDVETVLTYCAQQLHERVEPIDRDAVKDDWGYSYRANVNNPATLSCHASGTAFDWNATRHPNGHSGTFSPAQIAEIHRIVDGDLDGLVKWGGTFHGTPDEMHFEVHGTAAEIAQLAAQIRANQGDDDVTDQDKADIVNAVNAHTDARVNQAANDLAASFHKDIVTLQDQIDALAKQA